MHESCHTYVLIHRSDTCRIYEYESHIWMSHVTHINESCHTYEWVMSHIWRLIHMCSFICQTLVASMNMSHVRHLSHIWIWVMSDTCRIYSYMRQVSDMTHSYVRLLRINYEYFLFPLSSPPLSAWAPLLYIIHYYILYCTCTTWLIHMCDMTHSYVWHDSFICVTWLIHMYDMAHSYVCHDSFICATWLIHMPCSLTKEPYSPTREPSIWLIGDIVQPLSCTKICSLTKNKRAL